MASLDSLEGAGHLPTAGRSCRVWLPDVVLAAGDRLQGAIEGQNAVNFAHLKKKHPDAKFGVKGAASTAPPPWKRMHIVAVVKDPRTLEKVEADVVDLAETACDVVADMLGLTDEQVQKAFEDIRVDRPELKATAISAAGDGFAASGAPVLDGRWQQLQQQHQQQQQQHYQQMQPRPPMPPMPPRPPMPPMRPMANVAHSKAQGGLLNRAQSEDGSKSGVPAAYRTNTVPVVHPPQKLQRALVTKSAHGAGNAGLHGATAKGSPPPLQFQTMPQQFQGMPQQPQTVPQHFQRSPQQPQAPPPQQFRAAPQQLRAPPQQFPPAPPQQLHAEHNAAMSAWLSRTTARPAAPKASGVKAKKKKKGDSVAALAARLAAAVQNPDGSQLGETASSSIEADPYMAADDPYSAADDPYMAADDPYMSADAGMQPPEPSSSSSSNSGPDVARTATALGEAAAGKTFDIIDVDDVTAPASVSADAAMASVASPGKMPPPASSDGHRQKRQKTDAAATQGVAQAPASVPLGYGSGRAPEEGEVDEESNSSTDSESDSDSDSEQAQEEEEEEDAEDDEVEEADPSGQPADGDTPSTLTLFKLGARCCNVVAHYVGGNEALPPITRRLNIDQRVKLEHCRNQLQEAGELATIWHFAAADAREAAAWTALCEYFVVRKRVGLAEHATAGSVYIVPPDEAFLLELGLPAASGSLGGSLLALQVPKGGEKTVAAES